MIGNLLGPTLSQLINQAGTFPNPVLQYQQAAQNQCLAMMQARGVTNAFAQSAALASIANAYAQNPYVRPSEPDEWSDEVRSKVNGCEVPKWSR